MHEGLVKYQFSETEGGGERRGSKNLFICVMSIMDDPLLENIDFQKTPLWRQIVTCMAEI